MPPPGRLGFGRWGSEPGAFEAPDAPSPDAPPAELPEDPWAPEPWPVRGGFFVDALAFPVPRDVPPFPLLREPLDPFGDALGDAFADPFAAPFEAPRAPFEPLGR